MDWLCGDCEHYKNLDCKIGMYNCTKLFNAEDSKYRALLNNCTDNDEAILHKREIEENKSRRD